MKIEIRKVNPLILLLCVVALFISCDNSRVYEQWVEIPSSGWHQDSLCQFSILVEDTVVDHNLLIGIRNENNYAYQNLWVFITSVAPAGQTVTDTIQYELAESSGKWHGNGWGSLYTTLNHFKPGIRFAQSGEYKIIIGQGMRHKQLKGIRSIGFRVEKSN